MMLVGSCPSQLGKEVSSGILGKMGDSLTVFILFFGILKQLG